MTSRQARGPLVIIGGAQDKGGALSYTNRPNLSRSGSPLARCDLKLQVLPAGPGYSLTDRSPLIPTDSRAAVLGRSA
jgi:cyanophycinase-like exopeptidase